MEIPLDLERRLERRWAARFFRAKRIDIKDRINRIPLGPPPARTGKPIAWQRQEAAALTSGPIIDLAENGLVR
jgi:hypothetical protein